MSATVSVSQFESIEKLHNPLIWITGANGFLGGRIARKFEEHGYRVVGFSRGSYPDAAACHGNVAAAVGAFDAALLSETALKLGAPDVVVHCIGSGSVGAADREPAIDLERTIGTTETLVQFLRASSPKTRLIYLSSAAVYGSGTRSKMEETATPCPVSIYGQNKLLAERICLDSGPSNTIVVRLFSVFGSPQKKLLLWDIGNRLLRDDSDLILHGSGNESRDFMHVADVVAAIMTIAESRNCDPIINVGSGRPQSIRDVARQFFAALGATSQVRFNGLIRPGDPPHQQADIERLTGLGFESKLSLADGLSEYASWLRAELKSHSPSDARDRDFS